MKSQRRHELQKNDLEGMLHEWMDNVRPYWQVIAGVCLAAVIGIIGYFVSQSRKETTRDEVWTAVFKAHTQKDYDKLATLAKKNATDPAGQWASLFVGDQHLGEGIEQLFWDRAKAGDELKEAIAAYKVAARSKQPHIQQRAHYGLGLALESQPETSLDAAIDEYETVVSKWPDSVFAKMAEKRLSDLKSLPTQDFYKWFASQTPKMGQGTPGSSGLDFGKDQPFEGFGLPKHDELPKLPTTDGEESSEKGAEEGDAPGDSTESSNSEESDKQGSPPASESENPPEEKPETPQPETEKPGE